MFDDVLAANANYTERFTLAELAPRAARGLAVVTCIDSRIEPLQMLGLQPGDAKILRNAGGRVTPDVLRSLILATSLLSVRRVAVIHHTECALISTGTHLEAAVSQAIGRPVDGWDFLPIGDPDIDLAGDVDLIRSCASLATDVAVGGFRYDIRTGRLHEVVRAASDA
jgi:carbonic anhydrase